MEFLKKSLFYIVARIKEPSSLAAISWILGSLGFVVDEAILTSVLHGVSYAAGAAAILIPG